MNQESADRQEPFALPSLWNPSSCSPSSSLAATSVVWVTAHVDTTGKEHKVLTLLTTTGLLRALLEYSISHVLDRSIAWHHRLMRVVSLFISYVQANPGESGTYRLFRNFALRLHTGTFDDTSGLDPSGLCWMSRSYVEATRLQGMLREFFVHVEEVRAHSQPILPTLTLPRADALLVEAAYQHARSASMLGYTWRTHVSPDGAIRQQARFGARRPPTVLSGRPASFNDDEFWRFLKEGFRRGNRRDLRGMLLTLLLHFAGFRESEPFHLYTHDVLPDPDDPQLALVFIHHPALGAAPPDWRDTSGRRRQGDRRTYLKQKWNLVPRDEIPDRRQAGWKGGLLEEEFGSTYMRAYWFPEYTGKVFFSLWQEYMVQLACTEREHPFAFVNLARGTVGGMYCLPEFEKAHSRAVKRAGLEYGRQFGTATHGHRHAYGHRLSAAGVPPHIIRQCMHHVSMTSQEVYTQPTDSEVRNALSEGFQRMRVGPQVTQWEELLHEIRT